MSRLHQPPGGWSASMALLAPAMVGLGLGPSGQPSPSSSEAHHRLVSIPRASRARQRRAPTVATGHVTNSSSSTGSQMVKSTGGGRVTWPARERWRGCVIFPKHKTILGLHSGACFQMAPKIKSHCTDSKRMGGCMVLFPKNIEGIYSAVLSFLQKCWNMNTNIHC